jgi:hypothetical protein
VVRRARCANIGHAELVGVTGFAPVTRNFPGRRSTGLSYTPAKPFPWTEIRQSNLRRSAIADEFDGHSDLPSVWLSGSGRVERSGPKFLKLAGLLLLSLLQSRIIGETDSPNVIPSVGFDNPHHHEDCAYPFGVLVWRGRASTSATNRIFGTKRIHSQAGVIRDLFREEDKRVINRKVSR